MPIYRSASSFPNAFAVDVLALNSRSGSVLNFGLAPRNRSAEIQAQEVEPSLLLRLTF
jgi:hypothetical protein